jgi:hypothetical protein
MVETGKSLIVHDSVKPSKKPMDVGSLTPVDRKKEIMDFSHS